MNQTYDISGMHCGGCTAKVTAALAPYARDVRVTLDPPRAQLDGATTGDIALLNAALAKAGGYGLTPRIVDVAPSAAGKGATDDAYRSWLATYYPLLLIAGYIAMASLAGAGTAGGITWQAWMTNVMAGFFLVFSAFKFLDLRGFADAYASYDLLAKRWHGYGYIYPFLELALGLAYLFRVNPPATHTATILLMGFSSLGVLDALRNKRTLVCACLGTVLKLPMSTITLAEDAGMVAMAIAGLFTGSHN